MTCFPYGQGLYWSRTEFGNPQDTDTELSQLIALAATPAMPILEVMNLVGRNRQEDKI